MALKRRNQAKIIFFILAPLYVLNFQNVHRLELPKSFKFWFVHLPEKKVT